MDKPDTIRIPLRKRGGEIVAYAVVGAEDAHLADLVWHMNGYGYACRRVPNEGSGQRQRCEFMHRAILGLVPHDGLLGDHINRDRLDNRRSNLRVVNPSGNNQNTDSLPGSSSRYRGVSWHKHNKKWIAAVALDGRLHHLGYYHDEDAAGRAAAAWRAEHMPFSEDARSS